MDELRKALETIAFKNYEGEVSDDTLIKACDAYKARSESFLDDYDYHVRVAKSLYDHLNGIEPDEEICKAIIPGQTKVVDGVIYIKPLRMLKLIMIGGYIRVKIRLVNRLPMKIR